MQGAPKDPGVIPRVVKVSPVPHTTRFDVRNPTTEVLCAKTYVISSSFHLSLRYHLQHIFNKKSRLKKSTLKISFSYVEILVEEVYDLLVARKPGEVSLTCSAVSRHKTG